MIFGLYQNKGWFASAALAAALIAWPQGVAYTEDFVTEEEIIEQLSAPLMRGLKVVPTPSIALPMIQFEFNSFRLTPSAVKQLDALGRALSSEELKNYTFLIEGHTDSIGTREYNQWLSERRAASVRIYLVRNFGFPAAQLESVGFGEDRLLDPDDPQSSKNRRVEIVNAGQ